MNNEIDEKIEEKYHLCIKSLESKNEIEREKEDIKNIQSYLNTLFYFRRLKLFDPINVDNTVEKISKVIKYISIPKNNYVLKLGEKGNAFYLILKGKVAIMAAEYKKIYLTIEDYLIFLLKLFYFKEKELLKETIFLNKHKYMIEGNFEDFIKNIYIKQKNLEKEIRDEYKKDNNIRRDKKNLFGENLIKMIEKIFSDLSESKEQKGNIYLDYIFNNNFKENEVTPDKLISLVNIDHYSVYEKYLYKSFSIPFYFQINTLERGKYFGHTALETNSKGSITIITLQDTSFGIIEKNDYFRLLSRINRDLDMNFYSTLYNLPFFKNISKSVFQRFYSSFFDYHLYKRNKFLYKMNKKTNLLYLIKNGRFSIYIKGNMIELYDILIYLQTEKSKLLFKNNSSKDEEQSYNFKIVEKDERDDLIYNNKFKSKEFSDAINAKKEIFLGNFEGNNLIGLADFVNKNNDLSLFNIKIESNLTELYEITRKNFNTIISDYSSANDIVNKFEIKKLDKLINIISAYKNNFFASLEFKEKENVSMRLNLIKKEKETAILNKTHKTLKIEKLKKNIFLSLDKIKKEKEVNKNNVNNCENRKYFISSLKELENKMMKKNYSEKRKNLFIKEKILEKQNKELFLIETGDIEHKNNIFEMKKRFLSNQNSSKRFPLKPIILNNINNNFNNKSYISLSKSNNNNNNKDKSNYFVTDFFVDKIKDALYNSRHNNISKMKNENKLFYINMFMNGKNNMSSRNLLLNGRNRNDAYKRKTNKSVGTIGNKIKTNKEILTETNKLDRLKNKEGNSVIKRLIEQYKEKKKNIIDKLKIDIEKLQFYIDKSNEYCINRQKYLETQNELNKNHIYDDLFY